MKTEIVKTTAWLTRRYTEEELAKMKEEAIKEAEAELQKKQIEEMEHGGQPMKEQIEEMARIICNLCTKDCCLCDGGYCNYNCNDYEVATRLYNAGYRKLKEGEWKKVNEKYPRYVCTACNHLYNNKEYKYCPNCGAHVRGGKNE